MKSAPCALLALALLVLLCPVSLGQSADPPAGQGPLTWREIPPRPPIDYVLPRPSRLEVQLEVLVQGRPLRVIPHAGRDYLSVPEHGVPYEIRVRNLGTRRVTAIVSVDGLSVITGRPASREDAGYLVSPGDDIVIQGFRRDESTVAQFRFDKPERSHAWKRGQRDNIGVIGLLAIEEFSRPVLRREDRPHPLPLGATRAETGGTGTEAGPDIHSPTYRVPFVRGPHRLEKTYYYDTIDRLREAGIPVLPSWPNPFPGDR